MTQRTERVDELLRQEIGQLLAREVGDPRIGFVTITDVDTDPDLRHARVWVSVIGTATERDAAIAALGHAMPFIRRELGTRLRIRRIPELHVRLDDTLERGTRVLSLLSELEAGAEPADVSVPGMSLPTPVARLPHEGDAAESVEAVPGSGRPDAAPGSTGRTGGRSHGRPGSGGRSSKGSGGRHRPRGGRP